MAKAYRIRLSGCDDHTEIIRPLVTSYRLVLEQVAHQLNEASHDLCQPTMSVTEVTDEDEES